MTDYMDRIDWTAAPEWAQWVAMDSDGSVWWYEGQPSLAARYWSVSGGQIEQKGTAFGGTNWRESLRQRPSTKPEPAAPKTWRDMTPEERGALLLAHHEGKVIETWFRGAWINKGHGGWGKQNAYRIRPEPKRETVTRHLSHAGVAYPVTIDVVDGVLQWDTLKPLPKVAK
jgi:hypothetical protein